MDWTFSSILVFTGLHKGTVFPRTMRTFHERKETKVNVYSQLSQLPCATETHIEYVTFVTVPCIRDCLVRISTGSPTTLKTDFLVSSLSSGRCLSPTSNSSSSHNVCSSSANVSPNYRTKVSTQHRVASRALTLTLTLTLTCQRSHPGTGSLIVVGSPVCQNA